MRVPVRSTAAGLSLRTNFSWTFIGNLVYAGCQWGMLVVLARFGSPEMVGQFALGLAVTAPIIMLTNLQLRAVQATDARNDFQFGDYLAVRLVSTALALLAIVGATLVLHYQWKTLLVVLAVGLAKALEALSDVFYGLLQQHEQMNRIAISMMIKGLLSLAFLGTTVYATGSVLWGTLGMAAAWAAVLCMYDLRGGARVLAHASPPGPARANVLRPTWNGAVLVRLVRLTAPLGFVMMLVSLHSNIPRYVIEGQLGEGNLGIFSAMAYVLVFSTTIVSALGQSASPRLARYHAEGNHAAFRRLLFTLLGIGMLLGLGCIGVVLVAGRPILAALFQPVYAQHADVLIWLTVASAIYDISGFLGVGITAMRAFRVQVPIHALNLLLLSALCWGLVGRYGLLGAAWAMIASAVFLTVANAAAMLARMRAGR